MLIPWVESIQIAILLFAIVLSHSDTIAPAMQTPKGQNKENVQPIHTTLACSPIRAADASPPYHGITPQAPRSNKATPSAPRPRSSHQGITPRARSQLTPSTRAYFDKHAEDVVEPNLSSESRLNSTVKSLARSYNISKSKCEGKGKSLPPQYLSRLSKAGKQGAGYVQKSRQIKDHASSDNPDLSPNPGRGDLYRQNLAIEQEKKRKSLEINTNQHNHEEWVSPIAKSVQQVLIPCPGIRTDKEVELRYYIAKGYRELAERIEKCQLSFSEVARVHAELEKCDSFQKAARLFGTGDVQEFLEFCGLKPGSLEWKLFVENGKFVFRSHSCTWGIMGNPGDKPRQCTECIKIKSCVHVACGQRALPLACRKGDEGIHKNTSHKAMSMHPETASIGIEQLATENKRLKQRLARATFNEKMLPDMVEVDSDNPYFHAVPMVMEAAQEEFEKKHGDDEDQVIMWKLVKEHLQVVDERDGKLQGIRYHPEILNFALMLLVSSSHRVYNLVRHVFKLPSLEWVIKLQKKQGGSQDPFDSIHGISAEAISALEDFYEKEKIPKPNQRVALCFDSVTTKKGIQWDASGNMSGCDIHLCNNVVTEQFNRRAKALCRNDEDEKDKEVVSGIQNLEANMPSITEHFLVWKATVVHPNYDFSIVVARQCCASIEALRLQTMEDAIRIAFGIHKIRIMSICGDGAKENVMYFKQQCTEALSLYLSDETVDLFKKAELLDYLGFKIARKDPFNGDPAFYIEDMAHLIKRLVNTLDRSSTDKETRNLKFGTMDGDPLGLSNLRDMWYLTGGKSNQMTPTKLTEAHFFKDNFSKMRVYLAVQVVSNSVVKMIDYVCGKPEILAALGRDASYYKPLRELCQHGNRIVDIVNGRDPKNKLRREDFTAENGRRIQKELLEILSWFVKWEKLNKVAGLDEHSFLADATWDGLKRMILGYIGIIDFYVIGKDFKVAPRRTLSDPAEHLFSQLRNLAGSSDALTDQFCMQGVRKDAVKGQVSAKASYRQEKKRRTY